MKWIRGSMKEILNVKKALHQYLSTHIQITVVFISSIYIKLILQFSNYFFVKSSDIKILRAYLHLRCFGTFLYQLLVRSGRKLSKQSSAYVTAQKSYNKNTSIKRKVYLFSGSVQILCTTSRLFFSGFNGSLPLKVTIFSWWLHCQCFVTTACFKFISADLYLS